MKRRDQQFIYRLHEGWNSKTISVAKAGGQTNRNYVVSWQGKKFFVRLPWESDVIDRTIEGKNISTLARNKKLTSLLPCYRAYILQRKNILAPQGKNVFDVPDGTMLAEYIEGREFTFQDFQKKACQKALAHMLYALHASGVRFANSYDVFRDEIEKYRRAAQQYDLSAIAKKETIATMKEFEKRAKQKLRPTEKKIPAHNDLIFQNILIGKGGNIYLLDFEYAGMSYRGGTFYEFGFLFADNLFRKPRMTKEIFEKFLSVADAVYGRRIDRSQIYAASQAVIVMQFWWAILRYFAGETKKEKNYFAKYAKGRAQKIERFSRSFAL